MKFDKRSLAFLILGALIAISLEQLLWWNLILSQKAVHNDFWILISEDISSFQNGSKFTTVYSTDINQANLVLNIWEILLVIFIISLLVLILRKR